MKAASRPDVEEFRLRLRAEKMKRVVWHRGEAWRARAGKHRNGPARHHVKPCFGLYRHRKKGTWKSVGEMAK